MTCALLKSIDKRWQRDYVVQRSRCRRRRRYRRLIRKSLDTISCGAEPLLLLSRHESCKYARWRDAIGSRGYGTLHRQGPLQGQDLTGAHESCQTGERLKRIKETTSFCISHIFLYKRIYSCHCSCNCMCFP